MTLPTKTLDAQRTVKAAIAELVTATPDDGAGHSWDSTGRNAPAPAELVEQLLPGHTGPVCLGTLEQIASLTHDQWESDEGIWGVEGILTSTNREALGNATAAAIERPS